MYSPFQLAFKYLHYYLAASNGKGHGIHSPFVFDFIKHVLNDKKVYPAYLTVENRRRELCRNRKMIDVEDHGAGSSVLASNSRRISDIASSSLKPAKYGKLLFRIAKYYGVKEALELGTSFGVTTAYLSNGAEKVYTIEGSMAIAQVADDFFKEEGFNNINLYVGTFEQKISAVLQQVSSLDLAFIDGNHRYKPTLDHFEQLKQFSHDGSILIFDDIHWSREMEAAWHVIRQDDAVTLTIDLFFIGLVFFRKDFKRRQHFTIRF